VNGAQFPNLNQYHHHLHITATSLSGWLQKALVSFDSSLSYIYDILILFLASPHHLDQAPF